MEPKSVHVDWSGFTSVTHFTHYLLWSWPTTQLYRWSGVPINCALWEATHSCSPKNKLLLILACFAPWFAPRLWFLDGSCCIHARIVTSPSVVNCVGPSDSGMLARIVHWTISAPYRKQKHRCRKFLRTVLQHHLTQSLASHFDRLPYNLTNVPQRVSDILSTTWYKDATMTAWF